MGNSLTTKKPSALVTATRTSPVSRLDTVTDVPGGIGPTDLSPSGSSRIWIVKSASVTR